MDALSTLRTSLVLDRRAERRLAELRAVFARPTSAELRSIARRLRSLRPAWRAIGLTTSDGYRPEPLRPDRHQPGGDLLRLDLLVVTSEPLFDATAHSADDAWAKLEILSAADTDVKDLETVIYSTTIDGDPELHRVPPWPPYWYCPCGAISLEEFVRCIACGRARAPADIDEVPARCAA